MAQFKRTDGYALMNAVMAQLTGQDSYQVIDARGFMDAGKLALTYSTDEIFNALTIVGNSDNNSISRDCKCRGAASLRRDALFG